MTHIPLIPGDNLPANSAPGGEMARVAKELARRHGFDLAGITPPDLHSAYYRYLEWINRGYAGEMDYLTRRPKVRKDLRNVWADTQSALVVAMRYRPNESPEGKGSHGESPSGKIARYALGGDYHKFIKKRLIRVLRELKEIEPTMEGRTYVDTGPILERDLAVHCGIGWAGKNSLLLNRKLGSYFFIGTLLLNQRLPADPPMEKEHCGTCTLCITECPTDAIVAPNVIDSRRCISYLTIELRTPISRELRPLVGNHIFGCDICQEVCPWNDNAPIAVEPRFSPRSGTQSLNLHELLLLDEREFNNRFQGTPVMRAHYGGFLRNVAVAIGNTGDRTSIYPLSQALQHPEFLARGHAAWALGRIGSRTGLERIRQLLEARLYSENDEWVREEIELALGEMISTWNQPGNKVE